MPLKLEQKGIPRTAISQRSAQDKDAYGFSLKKTEHKVAHMNASIQPSKAPGVKAVFGNGVRVPILKDIENKYYGKDAPTSCRFDIVEKVKTVIKPGSYEPYEKAHNQTASSMARVEQSFSVPRHQTFHFTSQRHSDSKEKDVFEKISPYHWSKYVKTGREGDARDVLYRNTYCLDVDRVRYRSSTLPRIPQERPLSVSSSESLSKRSLSRASNASPNPKEITIIPQQPRGTIVRFREYMKPVTYSSGNEVLEVKRVSSIHRQPIIDPVVHMRNMLPLIRQDSRKAPRIERPMKFENLRYKERGFRNTLFAKQIHHSALEKNFHSADTFKEYLETLQMNATKMPTKQGREGMDTASSLKRPSQPYDVNTHALQSVVDVNKPDGGTLNAPPATEECSVTQDNRSAITIEIKSSWQQNERDTGSDVLKRDTGSDVLKHGTGSDALKVSGIKSEAVNGEDQVDAKLPGKEPMLANETQNEENIAGANRKENSIIKIPGSHSSDSGTTCPSNTPVPNIDLDDEQD